MARRPLVHASSVKTGQVEAIGPDLPFPGLVHLAGAQQGMRECPIQTILYGFFNGIPRFIPAFPTEFRKSTRFRPALFGHIPA